MSYAIPGRRVCRHAVQSNLRRLLLAAMLTAFLLPAVAQDSDGETANEADAISSATRLTMEPIWIAREFLMANFNDDAPHAVRVFAPAGEVIFSIPPELALGGPHSGEALTGTERDEWVTEELVARETQIFVKSNCEAADLIVIDAEWGRGDERLPVRLTFRTEAGYIRQLTIGEQAGPTPCEQ